MHQFVDCQKEKVLAEMKSQGVVNNGYIWYVGRHRGGVGSVGNGNESRSRGGGGGRACGGNLAECGGDEAETGREDVVWRDWKNTNWREAREEAETARAQVKAEWAKAKTRLRS